MKQVLCILSDRYFSYEKKLAIKNQLQKISISLNLPFKIHLFESISTLNDYDYEYAIVCFPPENIFKHLSSLKFVLSLNAGVESVIKEIPSHVNLSRIIYQPAIERMTEYVLFCIFDYALMMQKYRDNQKEKRWDRTKPFAIEKNNIGIMGMGNVGGAIAKTLLDLKKTVYSYSKTRKNDVTESFISNELEKFLPKTNILINALPLNEDTYGIINKKTLQILPEHSCIINIGRGGHIVENDLIEAIKENRISRAYLDVFEIEPLPSEHFFWNNKKISITPHISGVFDAFEVLDMAIDYLKEFHFSKQVMNLVVH